LIDGLFANKLVKSRGNEGRRKSYQAGTVYISL